MTEAVYSQIRRDLLIVAAVLVAILIDPQLFWRLGDNSSGPVVLCALAILLAVVLTLKQQLFRAFEANDLY